MYLNHSFLDAHYHISNACFGTVLYLNDSYRSPVIFLLLLVLTFAKVHVIFSAVYH
jgi:hypothetical protein